MAGGIFTLGYAHPDAAKTLTALMESNPKSLLVDIRYSPRSRWYPQWSKGALQAVYGDRYQHIKAFGNVNYRLSDVPIRLADPETGICWAVEHLQAGYSLILLCACSNYHQCHRKTVKTLIEGSLLQ